MVHDVVTETLKRNKKYIYTDLHVPRSWNDGLMFQPAEILEDLVKAVFAILILEVILVGLALQLTQFFDVF